MIYYYGYLTIGGSSDECSDNCSDVEDVEQPDVEDAEQHYVKKSTVLKKLIRCIIFLIIFCPIFTNFVVVVAFNRIRDGSAHQKVPQLTVSPVNLLGSILCL